MFKEIFSSKTENKEEKRKDLFRKLRGYINKGILVPAIFLTACGDSNNSNTKEIEDAQNKLEIFESEEWEVSSEEAQKIENEVSTLDSLSKVFVKKLNGDQQGSVYVEVFADGNKIVIQTKKEIPGGKDGSESIVKKKSCVIDGGVGSKDRNVHASSFGYVSGHGGTSIETFDYKGGEKPRLEELYATEKFKKAYGSWEKSLSADRFMEILEDLKDEMSQEISK